MAPAGLPETLLLAAATVKLPASVSERREWIEAVPTWPGVFHLEMQLCCCFEIHEIDKFILSREALASWNACFSITLTPAIRCMIKYASGQ